MLEWMSISDISVIRNVCFNQKVVISVLSVGWFDLFWVDFEDLGDSGSFGWDSLLIYVEINRPQ